MQVASPAIVIKLSPDFPEKMAPIFEPAPYKVIEGGRGKAASWTFARAMLILGLRKKLFCVVGREIQKSIEESAKKLLEDQIEALKLHEHIDDEGRHIPARYVVLDDEIRGSNGTRIVFVGVRTHVRKIKSYEGIDIFWAVEATHFSQLSWQIVMPTIRRDAPYGPFDQGSELWIDFNPDLASDYTYRFWKLDPPAGTVVISASWRDNPWFPLRMQKEMLEMKRKDYESYLNVYEGKPRAALLGAIYAKEILAAMTANPSRIGPQYKIDRSRPVDVSADLGRADTCSLLFTQQHGTDHLVGDYYGNVGFDWSHYLTEIQERKYLIRHIYLPHDAKNEVIQAKDSILTQTRALYPQDGCVKQVKVPKALTLSINAGRQLFKRLYINELECADWLIGMQHYQYGVKPDPHNSEKTVSTAEPLHNWASHPASAYHTYALGLRPEMIEEDDEMPDDFIKASSRAPDGQAWMGG